VQSEPETLGLKVIGLTKRFHQPIAASPRTREKVPPGYGTQEQCLPFVVANGLGFSLPSPCSWGYCAKGEAPDGAHVFQSPISGGTAGQFFYVIDDPEVDFTRNQFHLTAEKQKRAGPIAVPGLSFFDRPDQQDLVKLHLPYIFRTTAETDALIMPPINRPRQDGLFVLSGLVETDWYSDAVNLALRLPAGRAAAHVKAGEPIAQLLLLPRAARHPELEIVKDHSRLCRNELENLAEWRVEHGKDRAAYKRLVKRQL